MTQVGTSKLFGNPSCIPFIQTTVDGATVDSPGGHVIIAVAAATLAYGDLVFRTLGGRVNKTLNQSWYHARFVGVVVGGTATGGAASSDSSLIGTSMSAVGEQVVIQTDGVAYVALDATGGATYYGQPLIPGQTTGGRALAQAANLGSFAYTESGFAIHGAASLLGKVFTATQCIISGALGTAISVADTAALSGTVANGAYNIFECRSTGSTNQTTAMGTAGATLNAVVLPTVPAVSVATYGVIIIHPTGTGNFVGGTTALDDATVVPNAVYVQLMARYKLLGWFLETGGTAADAKLVRIHPTGI